MLKNNIEIDVKVKCVEEQTTQAELAEKTGTSPSYVNRLIKSPEKDCEQHLHKNDGAARI